MHISLVLKMEYLFISPGFNATFYQAIPPLKQKEFKTGGDSMLWSVLTMVSVIEVSFL
jgi:hypothetical protein